MIKKLDVTNAETADSVLSVQIPSYKVEAELIGFYGIPQLNDTVESVRNSGERFYGFLEDGALAGFIAVEDVDATLNISRLVVHPDHFRKGIGSKLVSFIVNEASKPITVSTGADNEPAITLYQKHGFHVITKVEVAPGFFLAQMFNPLS